MALNIKTIEGKLRPIRNRVLVTDMYFGEQKTSSGLIIKDDNGSTRGIYPRWGKVYDIGPENKEGYSIGDWVLVEHGRWTRGFNINDGNSVKEIRMVEAESIVGYSHEKPAGVQFGTEYNDGEHATVDPSSFVNPN